MIRFRVGEMSAAHPPWLSAVCFAIAFSQAASLIAEVVSDEGPGFLGPMAVAVSDDEQTLFAACADAGQVVFLRLPAGRIVRRVDVPGRPTGLAIGADQARILVSCAAPQSSVLLVNACSGKVHESIPVGHTAMSPVISGDGRWAYVCNRFSNNVSVLDLEAGTETARVAVAREPIAATLAMGGRLLLVANHLPNASLDTEDMGYVGAVVTMMDTQTHETRRIELAHGSHSARGLHVLADGRHALVTHLLANFEQTPFRVDMGWINVNVVSVIDVLEGKVLGTIGLDAMDHGAANPWGIASTADGASVCVAIAGTHELSVIDGAELLGEFARRTMQPMMGAWPIYVSLGESLWRRQPLPGIGPRALAVAGTKVYVAEYFSDSVAVFDLAATDGATAHSLALGPKPAWSRERWGEMLFHDGTRCFQHWQSCASCHPDARMDALNWDLLNDGLGNFKSTKSLLLAHRTPPSMARGVRATAEVAVRAGFVHILFDERPEEEAAAVDAYLRALRPVPSPQLVDGRLSPAAERGRRLFHSNTIACHTCHPAPLYTDMKMHNVGTRNIRDLVDRFDTPSLVEVWRTAPYLHDGRYLTVRGLLGDGEHGLSGGRRQKLTDEELDDLTAFVLSL